MVADVNKHFQDQFIGNGIVIDRCRAHVYNEIITLRPGNYVYNYKMFTS